MLENYLLFLFIVERVDLEIYKKFAKEYKKNVSQSCYFIFDFMLKTCQMRKTKIKIKSNIVAHTNTCKVA